MAKKQTFTSKLSKQESNFKHVKHIKSVISEESGHVKFLENIVRMEENENLDQALKRIEEEAKQVLSFGEALEETPLEEQPKDETRSEVSTEEAPAEEVNKETLCGPSVVYSKSCNPRFIPTLFLLKICLCK